MHLQVRQPSYFGKSKHIARLLIENGIDVNAKDNDGKTPIDRARERGDEALVHRINDYALFEAVKNVDSWF